MVLVPGMGDDVQAIKAGIMEIADIFVINKADQPGADRVEREVEAVLSLADGRKPPSSGPSPRKAAASTNLLDAIRRVGARPAPDARPMLEHLGPPSIIARQRVPKRAGWSSRSPTWPPQWNRARRRRAVSRSARCGDRPRIHRWRTIGTDSGEHNYESRDRNHRRQRALLHARL